MKKKILSIIIAAFTLISVTSIIPIIIYATDITAIPTTQKVIINGTETTFDTYNINGDIYFKLRDIAYVLNGTAKQFEVRWDGKNNTISLISGKPYTSVGGEMTDTGAEDKNATSTVSKIYLDGKEVSFAAYTIGGNNYFKLPDIGKPFGFVVGYDNISNTVIVSTNIVTSDDFLKQFTNFESDLRLLLTFNYNTTILGPQNKINEKYINNYLKTAVTPSPLYSLYKTYLLETELGTEFETVGEYERVLFHKDLVNEVILKLFNIDESKINWQDFKQFEVEGKADYFGLIIAFSGAYYDAEILYDTLIYSPDTNTVTLNIKFYEFGTEPERAVGLCTFKYEFQPFMYKDKIQCYKFLSVECVSKTNTVTWEADLTHDGKDEKIVVELNPPDFENTMCYKISVYDKEDKLIWSDEKISEIHVGNRGYYLYNDNGEYYMLNWSPWIGGRVAYYGYEIFSFDSGGNIVSHEKDSLSYNTISYSSENNGEDFFDSPPDEFKEFIAKINSYLNQSFILIDTYNLELQYSTPDNRIVRLFPTNWEYDLDGDSLPDEVLYTQGFITTNGTLIDEYSDNVEILDAYPKLTVNFGNGKSLTKSFINAYPDIQGRLGKYEIADIDGDELPEIIIMNTTMGSIAAYPLYILKYDTAKNDFVELFFTGGYDFTISLSEDFQYIVSCKQTGFISEPYLFSEHDREIIYNDDGTFRDHLHQGNGGVDGIYEFNIIQSADSLCIEVRQYAWGTSHVGHLGDTVSVFVWKNGGITLYSQRFEPYTG